MYKLRRSLLSKLPKRFKLTLFKLAKFSISFFKLPSPTMSKPIFEFDNFLTSFDSFSDLLIVQLKAQHLAVYYLNLHTHHKISSYSLLLFWNFLHLKDSLTLTFHIPM